MSKSKPTHHDFTTEIIDSTLTKPHYRTWQLNLQTGEIIKLGSPRYAYSFVYQIEIDPERMEIEIERIEDLHKAKSMPQIKSYYADELSRLAEIVKVLESK